MSALAKENQLYPGAPSGGLPGPNLCSVRINASDVPTAIHVYGLEVDAITFAKRTFQGRRFHYFSFFFKAQIIHHPRQNQGDMFRRSAAHVSLQ